MIFVGKYDKNDIRYGLAKDRIGLVETRFLGLTKKHWIGIAAVVTLVALGTLFVTLSICVHTGALQWSGKVATVLGNVGKEFTHAYTVIKHSIMTDSVTQRILIAIGVAVSLSIGIYCWNRYDSRPRIIQSKIGLPNKEIPTY